MPTHACSEAKSKPLCTSPPKSLKPDDVPPVPEDDT